MLTSMIGMPYNPRMQTPNIGAQRARAYAEIRSAGRAARLARINSAPEIARRAAEHRAAAESHMDWVRLLEDPNFAYMRSSVDHLAAATREYALAYEEEN